LSTFDRFSSKSSCWMTVIRGSCARDAPFVISFRLRRAPASAALRG
jgi:hypothetical protein